MKRFLRKTLLYFAILFCFLLAVLILSNYINRKLFDEYRITNKTSICIGDSHIQYAINDKLLPNTINLAQHSETLLASFFKIQKIIQKNPSIKKVYLGLGYHSFSAYHDDCSQREFSTDYAARYFAILPFEQKKYLIKHNLNGLPTMLLKIIFTNCNNIFFANHKGYSFLGKYENNFKNSTAVKSSMDKRIKEQFYKDGQLKDFCSINLIYLDSIINFCKKTNVELIIVNTPLCSYYRKNVPQKFIDKYYEVINKNRLSLIEFDNLALDDSYFIADGDHVSAIGATLTTMELSK